MSKSGATPRGSFLSSASPRVSSTPSLNLDDVNIKTWILNTSLIDNVTYYRILVRRGTSSVIQETKRRYNDFIAFREDLFDIFETQPTCPRCINIAKCIGSFEFPKKHYFSARSKVVVNYRMQAFRSFISMIVNKVFNPSPKCPTCSGKVVTIVLRFLLQNATILPENQIPRDGLLPRTETPKSTRSDSAATSFNHFPRSVSAPMSSLRGHSSTNRSMDIPIQPPPSKFTSLQRYSVPKEEQEDLYDDFDDDVTKKRSSRHQPIFDSFLHDKESASVVSDIIPDTLPQDNGDRTSESSDEEEIEMTGVFSTMK